MVAVERVIGVEACAVGAANAHPEKVVLTILLESEYDLDRHSLTVEGRYAFIEAIVEHFHPPVCFRRGAGQNLSPGKLYDQAIGDA